MVVASEQAKSRVWEYLERAVKMAERAQKKGCPLYIELDKELIDDAKSYFGYKAVERLDDKVVEQYLEALGRK